MFIAFRPIPLSLFLQLLSAYYVTVVLLGMLIFFLFPVCCDYFIASSCLVFHLMEYSGEHDISLHHKHILKFYKIFSKARNVMSRERPFQQFFCVLLNLRKL